MINNSDPSRKEEYEELNGNLLLSPLQYSTFPCLYYHHSFNPLSAWSLPFIQKFGPALADLSLSHLIWLHLISIFSHGSDRSVCMAIQGKYVSLLGFIYVPVLNLACIFQSLKYMKHYYHYCLDPSWYSQNIQDEI